MNITINFEDGQYIIIKFSEFAPLSSLIKLISSQTQFEIDKINLFYKNILISPELTLSDLNITSPPIFLCKTQKTIKISIPNEAEEEQNEQKLGFSSSSLISPDIKKAKLRWLQEMGYSSELSKRVLEKSDYNLDTTISILQSEKQKDGQSSDEYDDSDYSYTDFDDDTESSEKKEHKSKWNDEDDLLLYKKYLKYGAKWGKLHKYFPNKSINNIKHHWKKKLKPKLIRDADNEKAMSNVNRKWTNDENEILFAMWKSFGEDWEKISLSLHRRLPETIKDHWEKVMKPALIENEIIQDNPVTLIDKPKINFDLLFPKEEKEDKDLGITKDDIWTENDDISLLNYINSKGTASYDWDQLVSNFPKHTFEGIQNRIKLLNQIPPKPVETSITRIFPTAHQLIEVKKESNENQKDNENGSSYDYDSQEENASHNSNEEEEEEDPDAVLQQPPFDLLAKVWTPEEDQLIISCLKTYGYNWFKFVHLFPNVSYLAVQERYKMIKQQLSKEDIDEIEKHGRISRDASRKVIYSEDNGKSNDRRRKSGVVHWTNQEKEAFQEAFERYGVNYSKIQTMIPTKSIQAIVAYTYRTVDEETIKMYHARREEGRERTNESRKKKVVNLTKKRYQRFTPEEDKLLLEYGSNIDDFSDIVHLFEERSAESLRYRYLRLMDRVSNPI